MPLSKRDFDSQLKYDAADAVFKIQGNYIVFDNSSDLDYQIIPQFTLGELLTKNPVASYTKLNKDLILKLQAVCELWNAPGQTPLKINSSYRSPEYNKTVPGSSPNSRHCNGDAIDIGCVDPRVLAGLIDSLSASPNERGTYNWGCHMALGGTGYVSWDKTTDTSLTRKFRDAMENDSTRNYSIGGVLALIGIFIFTRFF